MCSVKERLQVDSLPEHLRPHLKERARRLLPVGSEADSHDGMQLIMQVYLVAFGNSDI